MVSQGNFSSLGFVAAKWHSNGLRSATVRSVLIADGVHKCEAAISVGVAGYTMGFYVRHALGVMSMGLLSVVPFGVFAAAQGGGTSVRWAARKHRMLPPILEELVLPL